MDSIADAQIPLFPLDERTLALKERELKAWERELTARDAESNRILEVITTGTGNTDAACKNLLFLVTFRIRQGWREGDSCPV